MKTDAKSGKVTATIEEVARYNMVLTEAILELLAERGILSGEEVLERVEKLKSETTLNLSMVQ
jgi:hypothetical protein